MEIKGLLKNKKFWAGMLALAALWPSSCTIRPELELFIKQMNPAVQNRFRCFLAAVEQAGWTVRVWSSWRGWQKSVAIWQTNPKVQACCRPGYDYHYFGLAIDITISKGTTNLTMASPREAWMASGIGEIAKRFDLRWGIDFRGYYDPVHFDYPKWKINDLVAQQQRQFGGLQNDGGNRIDLSSVPKA